MLISRKILRNIVSEAKALGKKIVFTNGCFDILHAGHVMYLERSANYGDILIIGLNSNDSVKRLKGDSRPVNDENDRAAILSALRCVNYVTIFEEDTPQNLINEILPDVLVKGGDYKIENIVGAEEVIENGGKVEIIDLLEGRSTTKIIDRMK